MKHVPGGCDVGFMFWVLGGVLSESFGRFCGAKRQMTDARESFRWENCFNRAPQARKAEVFVAG